MTRKQRLSAVLSIIREHEIENQDMLLAELSRRGFEVTQATISRDITYLGLEKSVSEDGVSRYVKRKISKSPASNDIFKQAVIHVDYALNTVVLKCHVGWGGAAGAAFDRMQLKQVVGTIAGDDTVFVLARTENDAKDLYEKLLGLL
jgi:transcriptional regulator of arginine metabolism